MVQLQGLFSSTLQCYFFLMKTRDSWMYFCSFIIINTTITTIIIIIIYLYLFYFLFSLFYFFFLCVAQVLVVLFLYSVLITVAGPTGQTVERTRWAELQLLTLMFVPVLQ